jgi:hypothetical protein
MSDINIESLSYYLSPSGVNGFKKIISSLSIIRFIWEDLEDYIVALETTRWLDSNIRDTIINNIRKYLTIFLETTYNLPPSEIFNQWLTNINNYCFQGGFGHAIAFPDAPHHWVIRPEHYSKVSSIPPEVQLACIVIDKYININCRPMYEKWSG